MALLQVHIDPVALAHVIAVPGRDFDGHIARHHCLATQPGMQRQAGGLVQAVQLVLIGGRKIVVAGLDDELRRDSSGAGAASSAGVLKLDAEVDGDVQQGLRLPVLVVGELAGLKLDSLIEVGEGNLGHAFIFAYPLCIYHDAHLSYWWFMFHLLERRIAEAFASRIQTLYQLTAPVQTEQPKQPSFGEFAVPAAFQLARELRKAPRVIAQELLAGASIEGVAAIEIAGNGYLNVRLDRGYYGAGVLSGEGERPAAAGEKIIVEHTNINPNKAAHIGHLRNAILGDTFVRMLRAAGREVEVQNYIDNTGVQVGDVVVAFLHPDLFPPRQQERFDYLCWDLYAAVSAYYDLHPEALAWRRQALHDIEAGGNATAEKAHEISDKIVHAHLTTMWRLNIVYDVLPRESEILHLQFWATAFGLLKQLKAIYFETEGKNAGCWVMPGSAFREGDGGEDDSKVIVRSNGTVTYVGKDIAYQLWKFGLLGKDFYYRPWHTYPNGHVVWASTDVPLPICPKMGRRHSGVGRVSV